MLELLFMHGRYESHEHWRVLTDQLDFDVRCSFLNMPGFGRTLLTDDKPLTLSEQVEGACKNIISRNRELILVGHDIGAVIIQLAALETETRMPHLIRGLILLNSASLVHLRCPKLEFSLTREMRKLLQSAGKNRIEQHEKIRCPDIAHLRSLSKSWPNEEGRIEIHRKMRCFKKPVLVLWGKRDSMNTSHEVNEIVANFPNIEFYQEDSIGHWPWIEYPQWVSKKVQEFLFRTKSQFNQKSSQG